MGWGLSMSVLVDEKYYQQTPDESLAEHLLIIARDRIYKDFIERMQPRPSDLILDVGVSDVIGKGANVLERRYPEQQNITACGLGYGTEFRAAFPKVNYVQIRPNARLPFDDGSFAIATANAVLEHVGSFENQAFFVQELCRVAERVFISVPNKFFPIEHHTALPLVHFEKRTFKIAAAVVGKAEWTNEENLILITRKLLWRLAVPIEKSAAVGYTGMRLGPFSSNLFLALH
jgi:hypothetical protein